jgi:hypothetical protein
MVGKTQPLETRGMNPSRTFQNLTRQNRFLGYVGYCRRFVPQFRKIAATLHKLLKMRNTYGKKARKSRSAR